MKIKQLLSGVSITITNEENAFIKNHGDQVNLTSLDDHDNWLAQSLVRKGVYTISKDSNKLIKNIYEAHN
jgi:hypothetical protein